MTQLHAVDDCARSASSRESISTKHQTAATKAPATEAVPISPAARRLIVLPASVIASAPASGRKRQIQAAGIIPAQGREAVGVERDVTAGHGDDEPEADDDLRGGDGHHGEGEDLAVERAVLAREGDQREVGRVQHQLQREQDDQRVAAQEHAERTDGEEDGGDGEVPRDSGPEH